MRSPSTWALAALVLLTAGEARADEAPRGAVLPRPSPVRPVPPPPPPPQTRTRMNCVGCAIAGGVVLGAGAAHALVGGIELSDPAPGEEDRGRVLLVLAGIHGLIGIPLLVAGLWPVETTGARAAEAGDFDLRVGAGAASLRVAF
jgi:hypothetical protein